MEAAQTLKGNTDPLPWEKQAEKTTESPTCSRIVDGKSCTNTDIEIAGGYCQPCKEELYGNEKRIGKKWTVPAMQARLMELSRESKKARIAERLKRDVSQDAKEYPELF